jgi:hypothetical protein
MLTMDKQALGENLKWLDLSIGGAGYPASFESRGGKLNHFSPQKDTLQRRPRNQESGVRLFAESKTRLEVSQLDLIESLHSFFRSSESAGHASLFVFPEETEETQAMFDVLRRLIGEKLGLPVLLAWGPRSMDSYGCLLREEAPKGLHLVITGESSIKT